MGNDRSAMERFGDQQAMPAERILDRGETAIATRTEHAQTMALMRPRELEVVAERVVNEAAAFPEGLTYSWKAGKGTVEGCGIKAAMLMVRNWGNCEVNTRVVSEGPESWLFEGEFYDQETNVFIRRNYRQRRTGRTHGKVDAGRVEDADFQIGQSKAIRSAVLAAMPQGLQDAVFKAARKGAVNKLKKEAKQGLGLVKQAEKALGVFASYKVTQEMMEARLGKPMDQWEAEDIQGLRELYQALEEGHTSVGKEFPEPAVGEPPEDAAASEE